ncbi:MAG TPA: ATP synthase subunit C [Steroidobacteraceae bacterium]|nr:ATP synthase subunit C [Steroidobacteraceae bacterium]
MKLSTAAVIVAALLAACLAGGATVFGLVAPAASAAEAGAASTDPGLIRWAFASAAAAAGLSALAAGYAVAQVGTAAVGALAEKPELFGRMLVLVGLAEGIAIYGLIVAVLIFNRVG